MNVLIAESEGFSEDAVAQLQRVAEVTTADLSRERLLESLPDVEILWVRLRTPIDREVLERGARLRAIVTATTGLDHVDLEACKERGVEVFSLRGERDFLKDILATAEHTVLLMLAWLRRLPAATSHVVEGGWDRDLFRGGELRGRTVGVLGYGRLGTLVARLLVAFGAEVLTSDPEVNADQVEAPVTWVPPDVLLSRSAIVSLHVPLDATTRHLIDRAAIDKMRPDALLVNTSRGDVVDELALLEALKGNTLGGYATDVLHGERATGMAHHPLVELAASDTRVLVTPHIGGATWESTHKTEEVLAARVAAWIQSH
jgi:D-3-phosphoglycerate dehydrogenase